MKVTNITVKNVKNVEMITIALDPHMNIVGGNNGAGKSTLIESIFMAILGKKVMGKDACRIIRKDQDKATIALTLQDTERTIDIERRITEKGVYINIYSSDGTKFNQDYLDSLLSEFTVDPLAFSRLKPKEQIETVKRLANIDTALHEQEYEKLYNERTYINRTVKEQEAVLDNLGSVRPAETINVSSVSSELEVANESNRKIEDLTKSLESGRQRKEKKAQEIKDLEEQLAKAHTDYERADKRIDEIEGQLKGMKSIDTAPLREKIAQAEEVNKQAVKFQKYMDERKKFDEFKAKQDEVNAKMDAVQQTIKDTITKANLPINNAEFDPELGLIVDGVPFNQKSSAEQLKIATELATFANPQLKVVYIKDGSLLDANSKAYLAKLAEDKDYQILMEVVGTDTQGSIILSEGHLI